MAIRIGVVGGGIFGEMHLQTFSQCQRGGRCELVSLADLNEDLLAKRREQYGVRTYRDYREMLAREHLDGVSVVTPDPTHLQQARNFMTNTLNAFIGTMGASSLLQRISEAQTHEHLRELFDEWFHTLVNSREGRREAEALRGKLLQVI